MTLKNETWLNERDFKEDEDYDHHLNYNAANNQYTLLRDRFKV